MADAAIRRQARVVRTPIQAVLASLALASLALASLPGCYATHESSGITPRRDAGASDSAIPIGRDAGPFRRDAGPPPTDCREEVVLRHSGPPPCSEAVNECIRGCTMGDDCVGMCIATEPECQRCFYQDVIACSNELGCLEDWRTFACCAESVPVCSDLSGIDRINCAGSCMADFDAYSMCLNTFGMMCFFGAATDCGIRFGG